MHELFELLPVVAGVAIALLCRGVAAGWRRALVVGVLGVACGVGATVASGEYRHSWGYLLLDVPLTAGIAAAVLLTPRAVAVLARSLERMGR